MAEQEEDKSQKTEQPTAYKLEKARKDGQVGLSKEVGHWFMLLALALILTYLFPGNFSRLTLLLKYYFEHSSQIAVSSSSMIDVATYALQKLAGILALPVLFLIIAAITSGLVQTRGVISTKGMKPKLSKVSPKEGLKRLFGAKALVEFLKNISKLAIIMSITYLVMRPEFDRLHSLPQLSAFGVLEELSDLFLKLLVVVISVITVVAALDYGYQKYKFIQDLKMSKKEIKDEYKELVGDPHIKGKLRQIREERARSNMMQDVPQATVIMTNPTHYAVALKYDLETMDTPILLAKGSDLMALKIKELGEENNIPIIENPPLTRAIYANVKIKEEIPAEYFEAVARVIRYVFGYDTYYQSHLDEGIDEDNSAKE